MKVRWSVCIVILCIVFVTGCSIHDTEKSSRSGADLDAKATEANATPAAEASASNGEDSSTGEDISNEKDSGNEKDSSNGKDSSTENEITMDAAKKIALKKAGLTEKDGEWRKEKMDYDDGRSVYELEFVSGELEYDFEIDAQSGNILEFEKDSIYD